MNTFISCLLNIFAFLLIGNFTSLEFRSTDYLVMIIAAVIFNCAGQFMRGD